MEVRHLLRQLVMRVNGVNQMGLGRDLGVELGRQRFDPNDVRSRERWGGGMFAALCRRGSNGRDQQRNLTQRGVPVGVCVVVVSVSVSVSACVCVCVGGG
jgi:hypothetical protein